MAENKTKPTKASVAGYIASRADEEQSRDCARLIAMMKKITRQEPKMWGPSIVGFGSYHYRYESGREGESCLTGFAIRKSELVIYLAPGLVEHAGLLSKLGKHRMGKGCLYLKRLKEVDTAVLEGLIAGSVAELRRRHG